MQNPPHSAFTIHLGQSGPIPLRGLTLHMAYSPAGAGTAVWMNVSGSEIPLLEEAVYVICNPESACHRMRRFTNAASSVVTTSWHPAADLRFVLKRGIPEITGSTSDSAGLQT